MTTTTPDPQEMHTEFEAAAGTDGAPDFVHRPSVLGRRYMISSVHYHATMGGLRILEQGGNAIDAGVAAGICLNVVEPQSAMFGGVAPIVVFLANGADNEAGSTTAGSGRSRVFTVSGLGRWPQAASLDDYRARYDGDLPAGVPRTVTPGTPDAWLTALARFGTLSLAEVLQPALELAREGFPMWSGLHQSIASAAQPGYPLTQWPSSAAVWMPGGRVPAAGEIFRQPDLASTFQRLINAEAHASGDRAARIMAARDLLYRGELAQQIASFYQEEGSILTAQDLAEFAVKVEPPAHTTYRGYDVYSCGPWCQGPTLLQALNLLEGFDLRAMRRDTAAYLHTVAEALDLAFADRERYYGDPDLIDVPLTGLLSKDYAAARRELIREGRTWGEMPPAGDPWSYQNGHGAGAAAGIPPRPDYREPEADTAYVCVVDADGNTFSATPSDGIFGSPIVPGLGFAASSRGTQTWLDPQHASRLQPWKRPRLTPNPALALRDGHSFMPFGCPGRRSASAGDVAGVPQRGGVRSRSPSCHRVPADLQRQLPELVLAARLPPGPAERRDTGAGRRARATRCLGSQGLCRSCLGRRLPRLRDCGRPGKRHAQWWCRSPRARRSCGRLVGRGRLLEATNRPILLGSLDEARPCTVSPCRPAPRPKRRLAVKYYGLTLCLRDNSETIEQYKEYHRHVWPEVTARLGEVGITQMKIFLLGTRLFMYMETTDEFDPRVDFPRYTEDPKAQEWDELMRTFQQRAPEASPDEWWALMEPVFELLPPGRCG